MRPVYCYKNCLTIYSYRFIVVKHVHNAATISCRKFVVASEINALENAIDLVVVLHLSVAATTRAHLIPGIGAIPISYRHGDCSIDLSERLGSKRF